MENPKTALGDRVDIGVRLILTAVIVSTAVAVGPQTFDVFGVPKWTVVLIGLVLSFALELSRIIALGEIAVPRQPAVAAAGVFLLLALATALFSRAPLLSIVGQYTRYGGALTYLALGTFFVLGARAFRTTAEPLIVGMLGTGLVVGVVAAAQHLGADPLGLLGGGSRVVATLGNSNFVSTYLGLMATVAFAVSLDHGRRRELRIAAAVLAAGLAALTVVSGDLQGPIVVVAGAAAVGLLRARTSKPRVRSLVAAALTVLAVGGASLVALGVSGRGPVAAVGAENSVQLRLHYVDVGLRIAEDNLVRGVGFDLYDVEYRNYRTRDDVPTALGMYFTPGQPHSVPLGMFVSGGVPLGLSYLAFVALVGVALYRGSKAHPERTAELATLGGAWFGYQVQSAISIDVAPLAALHWVLAGAILARASAPQDLAARLPWAPVSNSRDAALLAPWQRRLIWGAAILAVLGVWTGTRPLRADVRLVSALRAEAANDLSSALQHVAEAEELAPWEARYRLTEGQLRSAQGNVSGALSAYASALDRDPGWLRPAVLAADVAARSGQPEVAADWYRQALQVEPNMPELKLEAARFALDAGDPDWARRLVEDVLAEFPDDVDALEVLTRISGNGP